MKGVITLQRKIEELEKTNDGMNGVGKQIDELVKQKEFVLNYIHNKIRPGIRAKKFLLGPSKYLIDMRYDGKENQRSLGGEQYQGRLLHRTIGWYSYFPYIGLHHLELKHEDGCFLITGYLFDTQIDILLVGNINFKDEDELRNLVAIIKIISDFYIKQLNVGNYYSLNDDETIPILNFYTIAERFKSLCRILSCNHENNAFKDTCERLKPRDPFAHSKCLEIRTKFVEESIKEQEKKSKKDPKKI